MSTQLTEYQNAGEAKKTKADLEHDASHATAKIGNVTASSSGAVTKDDPNRTEGSWNQVSPYQLNPQMSTKTNISFKTIGSAKESVGGLIGNQSLKNAGAQQNAEGKAQEAQGQLNDFGSGVADRVSGAVAGGVAGLTGDRDAQLKAQEQHDKGKTQQRSAEVDIQKQNS